MLPEELVEVDGEVGVVYSVNEGLKQASVAFPSLRGAVTAVGYPRIVPFNGKPAKKILELRDEIHTLRQRLGLR
jgi:hypothetical protein